MTVTLHCGDCRDIMRTLPDGCVDAVITDPPYGINLAYDGCNTRNKTRAVLGDTYPFDPTPFLRFGIVVLWGGNNFAAKLPRGGWLVWDKRVRNDKSDLANQCDGEIAWTNTTRRVLIFRHLWIGAFKDSEHGQPRLHPTQKPVELMKWCLDKARVPRGATVLDPFMGSGTTGVACVQTGRNFIGIEIDKGYFEIAQRRIAEAEMQPTLIQA